MKVKTKEDIEKLDLEIQEELGIDVKKYRNEEVVENFVDLLVFPEYIFTWTIKPILMAILIYIIGFFVVDLIHVEYIIYGLVGFVLFLITGILYGLLSLTKKMKLDLSEIIGYSLNMTKSAIKDYSQISTNLNPENKKEVLGLLFSGIVHVVTIPTLTQVISAKASIVGGMINKFVIRVFTLVSDRIDFDGEIDFDESDEQDKENKSLDAYIKTISSTSKGINKILNFTFKVGQFPLRIGFYICLSFLLLFIYLIW